MNDALNVENVNDIIHYIKESSKQLKFDRLVRDFKIDESILYNIVRENKLFGYLDFSDKASKCEIDVITELNSIQNDLTLYRNDRTILDGKELDIYLPDYKLAIEINGDYWHCSSFKDTRYHQLKTIQCMDKDIELIHIFEHELICKNIRSDIFKLIENKLIDFNELTTTNCWDIRTVNANDIITRYNLGISKYKSNIALQIIRDSARSKDDLIGNLTGNTLIFSSNDLETYTITLNSTPTNDRLVAFGYLVKYFIKTYKPKLLMIEADITKNIYKDYERLGFKRGKFIEPRYTWIRMDYTLTEKQKVDITLGRYYNRHSDYDKFMYNNGYCKIYDAGKQLFTIVNNDI